MENHQNEFSVVRMCEVLNVSRSGYYNWIAEKQKEPTKRQLYREELKQKITKFFHESLGTYGAPRIHKDLLAAGYIVSEKTVGRYMREMNLYATPLESFVVTTDSDHEQPIFENLLKQKFETKQPNEVWVSDITYIWNGEGWVYLAAVLDLYSRKIVGWQTGDHMKKELALEALDMAINLRQPEKGLIHHSDRGSQYASHNYRDKLEEIGALGSMSRKGNPYDNACIESFFATLKKELVYRRKFLTREEAVQTVNWYISVFYNEKRRHSKNNYLSPNEFEHCRQEEMHPLHPTIFQEI
nr:IS3 family transposase [Pisciglobus halotolerans]